MPDFVNDFKCLDCSRCFKKNQLFQKLNNKELEYVNNYRLEVRFKKGEIVFKQGTPFTHVVILHEGLGKLYIEGRHNKNLIIGFAKPYELVSGPGMFIDSRNHFSFSTITDAGACFIEAGAIKEVLKGNAVFAEEYMRACSQGKVELYNIAMSLTQKNMEGRIADALLFLQDQIFNNNHIKYVNKQDIADLTAMSKESAIRVLKEFKSEGLIEEVNSHIEILDPKALKKISVNS
ncbi:Crp/Fnr family transcriptional regulator [Bacteroidota bacterium]